MWNSMILYDILEEHIEEADFLFEQRKRALESRNYSLPDLAELEERILAHIDGLILGEPAAWKLVTNVLAGQEFGGAFVAGMVAFASADSAKIDEVCKLFAQGGSPVLDGIKEAMQHASNPVIPEIAKSHLADANAAVGLAALDVLSFRRVHPGDELIEEFLTSRENGTLAAGLRAAGRLRLTVFRNLVDKLQISNDQLVRLEAVRAGLLLDSPSALTQCREAVNSRTEIAGEAAMFLGLNGRKEDLIFLLDRLRDPVICRSVILALGHLGYTAAVERLIDFSRDPKYARVCGYSLEKILGANILAQNSGIPGLSGDVPPAEDENDLLPEHEEGMPVPDSGKLASWWAQNHREYDREKRYRYGLPYGRPVLEDTLRKGSLAERHKAALELAIMSLQYSYLETRAFASRQEEEMKRI